MNWGLYFLISLSMLLLTRDATADFGVDYELRELTHMVDENTIYWPGMPSFELTELHVDDVSGSDATRVEANKFCSAEHAGTHLDAPYHFNEAGLKVAEIPLKNLISKAVLINLSSRASQNRDTQLTIDDIIEWETKHGRIPDGAIVLMNSGWHKKYPNRMEVFSTDEADPSQFHFPGFHPDAVEWLLQNRPNINGIGVDTPSIDYGQSTDFLGHRRLGGGQKYGLENVANLDAIPEDGAIIYALPYKLTNGTGAPVHIIATWPKDGKAQEAPSIYVDMTHPFDADSIYLDGNPSFEARVLKADSSYGFWLAVGSFCASEHGGTHIDAPRHVSKAGLSVGEIPVDRLVGRAAVIDISARAEHDRDATLNVDDLVTWERRNGRIPDGAIVLMNSGWTHKYPNKLHVFGTSETNASLLHFPGFSADAAQWLVDHRPAIAGIGVDTPSLDAAQSIGSISHRTILEKNLFGLENVANLDQLPETGATLIVLAYRLAKGTGAPAYVVGKIPSVMRSSRQDGEF